MVGIWFPISTFVAIGLEHSVANMFLLPLGLLGGAEKSVRDVLVKNLLPVTIGNAIAGAFIVAAGYSYQFGHLGGHSLPLPPPPKIEDEEKAIAALVAQPAGKRQRVSAYPSPPKPQNAPVLVPVRHTAVGP